MNRQFEFLDLLTIMSFILQVQNLEENYEQTKALQEHLEKQDEQYEEIKQLLKEIKNGRI